MSIPFQAVARASTLMLLAACMACGGDATAAPRPTSVQVRLTCTSAVEGGRHWDRLRTMLVRNQGGVLTVTGAATLVPFRGLERLRDEDFSAQQAVAELQLEAAQGAVPAGRYCMTAQLTGSAPSDLGAWTVRYYAITSAGVASSPTHTTRGLAYRTADSPDDVDRPRPAARFHFWRRGERISVHPPRLRLVTNAGATPDVIAAQNLFDDGYSAWYRCGSGCCGASLNF